MITAILDFLIHLVVSTIDATGYSGIFLLMLAESCGIPIPSEVIMPFAGFLVGKGTLSLFGVVLSGAFGNLIGSLLAYYIGWKGGRPLIAKYGQYILISHHDLDLADRWFGKHGNATVFFGRLLPVVRTYISFPAGISRMNLKTFSLYTFLGALPWATLFAWLGMKMQQNWEQIHETLQKFDIVIGILILAAIIWYVRRHLRHRQAPPT